MPVSRLKNMPKAEGLGKLRRSAISLAIIFLSFSMTLACRTVARLIQYKTMVSTCRPLWPLTFETRVER